MRALPLLIVCILCLSAGCSTLGGTPYDGPTGIVSMTTIADGEERPCALYIPPDYTSSREWPLVVFLHGAGERGDDGIKQTTVGIGPAIVANPDRFPCLVVMPQCPQGSIANANWSMASSLAHIANAIAQVQEQYNVEEDQIALTGLSLGGFGSFAYANAHPDQLSAVMPICGGGETTWAPTLAQLPFWVFHGADDSVVPAQRSRDMVAAIEAAGGDIRYTEYPGVNHNSWDNAYGDAAAIAWLLEQER